MRRPELVADSLLATFQALYGEGLGPRSTDILSNALSVLARTYQGATQQAQMLSYLDSFKAFGWIFLALLPLLLLVKPGVASAQAHQAE